MTDNYDQLALSWVRKEINNTLDQARQGLETFVEDSQDQTQIQFCINCLHQVQGTLKMLGFDGAARLALEMETLAEKLAKKSSDINESSIEVLMRSMHQMPGYLERVESGQKDIPVVLLPLINELRSSSNLGPVSENELFTADTSKVAPPKPNEQVTEKDKTVSFQENARKLRAHFQKGLTGIIRSANVKDCLARIHKVLLRLEALTEGSSVARLWWVADGFIFSIAENGHYKEKNVHLLLSQIDKQIKRLADTGDSALNDEVPPQLLSKLLYFVARSKSKNSRVLSLKKEFNLHDSLAESKSIKKQQEQLTKPDRNAMAQVVDVIGEELDSVKDQLDLFVRAQAKDPAQLRLLSDSLTKIADTLTILELPIPRDVIREQIKNIQKTMDLGKVPDDAAIMDIAGALLFVDANLSNFDLESFAAAEESKETLTEVGEQRAKENQVIDATHSLVKVARKNLQQAKDRMINYIASTFDQSELENVPSLLDEVLGAMNIIEFDEAAEVLEVAKKFIQKCLLNTKKAPNESHLDALADIVTSVDYYLEGTEDEAGKAISSILRSAQSSQNILIQALDNFVEESQEPEFVEPRIIEKSHDREQAASTSETPVEEVETVASKQVETAPANVVPIIQSSASKEVDESLIDDEVLEIFLEEAEEEIEAIETNLPVWINQSTDQEALGTIRRSFHTLKGSGRLVGATTIGELSWAVENMLNKVIEESIPAENPVINVLNNTLSILPKLVEEFSKNEPHQGDDVDELIARAEHIAKGLNLNDFVFVSQTSEPSAETRQVEAEKTESQEVEIPTLSEPVDESIDEEPIDPVLLEIFVTEAQVHLKAIGQFISDAGTNTSVSVTDSLIRALHTLKGSAHMAKVESIAQIAGPLEKHARLVKGSNSRFDLDTVTLLDDCAQFLNGVVTQLKKSEPIELAQFAELSNRIATLTSVSSGQEASGQNAQQKDQHLVSIFLTEGLDILQEVGKILEILKDSPKNDDAREKISSELHAFKRGSEMIASQELYKLSEVCESVSHLKVEDGDGEREYQRLLSNGVDQLTEMLNRRASEEDIEMPNALIDEMQSWIEEMSRSEAPADMDQELVELFVEEADELAETVNELLVRWKEHLNSDEINKELRRIYHTFKGSSRMAGAMNIGDLAFSVEEIFNKVLDFGGEFCAADYDIVSIASEKLTEMVGVLRNFRWPAAATDELAKLKQHLTTGDDSDAQPELEITETVAESVHTEPSFVENYLVKSDLVEKVAPVDEIEVDLDSAGENLLEEESSLPEEASTLEEIMSEDIFAQDSVADESISLDYTPQQTDEIVIADLPTEESESIEIQPIESEADTFEIEDHSLDAVEEAIDQVIDFTDSIPEPATESSEAVVSEDTIAPAAPIVVSGNVHKIDLDEDGLEVLEIYLEEADELLVALDEAMHLWGSNLSDQEAIDTLQRTLHTFKGGARLSDLVVLGDLTHEMETYFEKVNSGDITAKNSHLDFMLKGYDVIESLVNEVKDKNQMTLPEQYFNQLKQLIAGNELDETVAAAVEDQVAEVAPETIEDTSEVAEKDADSQTSDVQETAEVVSFEQRKQQQEDNRKQTTAADSVRVNSNQLENLVNLAGETSIFRSRLEQQMTVLRYNLEEMNSTVDRLKDQLRNLDIETEAQISYRREISGGVEYDDFDPLEMDRYTRQQELTRGLGESAVDLMNLKDTLDALTSDSETLLLQQGRVNTEMQEGLMQTRMTPFESLVPRLRRMIRQISTELGKTIELSISADGEMDRSVLERMIAPLEHMLRNAMDHGIETPAERKKAGKLETGKIAISLFREGSEVFIRIKDDGRGLNLEAIKKKAIERGVISKDTELSQHELQQLILEAGFSTAETVTQISGRGVGMDVVNSEIKQLGGVIEIDSRAGVGSTFTVRLPFTVSVNHALMVQIGEELYAIPLANIEGIVRVSPFELEEYYNNTESKFGYAGIDYSVYYLGKMLDHHTSARLEGVSQPLPVLLLHGADHPTALQVDDLLGSREIVVKSTGSQLSSVSGISGATIQGDGRVVLILDMPALVRRVDATVSDADFVEEIVEDKIPTVMVVDDSITVRKVTTRLLERNNFEVITAKDGVDAVSVLADKLPDVMLLDIEMPRMDGFELATIIRHDERLKYLPIIMITSRTGEKHRERAEAIGVNQYMGKPYNEVDLLETINGLLSEET